MKAIAHGASGKSAFILPFYDLHLFLIERGRKGMGKPFTMYALCIISAAFGAAIDHYLAGAIEQSGQHLERAVSPQVAVAAPAELNVEVLGDRVRCDFRYQELKIPATEYQSFKRKCMADRWDRD
jgi:hypothetical protein